MQPTLAMGFAAQGSVSSHDACVSQFELPASAKAGVVAATK